MTTPNANAPRFVLVAAIDESQATELVVSHAASLARVTPGTVLHLAHIADPAAEADLSNSPFDLDRHRNFLDARCREAQVKSGVSVFGHLLEGAPADGIVQLAASLDADLVIVGTRDKRGPERWLLGSVAQRVMQRAACPVLVMRAKDHVAARAPEVEAPCPDCVRVQQVSRGARLWCGRHSEHHPRAHLHYEAPEGFGAGSSLLQP